MERKLKFKAPINRKQKKISSNKFLQHQNKIKTLKFLNECKDFLKSYKISPKLKIGKILYNILPKNQCILNQKKLSSFAFLKLSRFKLRESILNGHFYGINKSSW